MDLLIQNGLVVTAENSFLADVAVDQGKIIAIGGSLNPQKARLVVDARDKLVLPGAIDAHVHMALPVGALCSADDYFTGTRAAACGGTTTIFDYGMQAPGEALDACVERYQVACQGQACVDYGFHIGIRQASATLPQELGRCIDLGVTSFKAYMIYDFSLSDGELFALLEQAGQAQVLVAVHAENKTVVQTLIARYLGQGNTQPWYHYLSRPEFVEEEAVVRAIALAKAAKAPLYLVHLSAAGSVKAVAQAQREGAVVFAETCPQYLHFTNRVYQEPLGKNFVCSPSIKGQASRAALWQGLQQGVIGTVGTDHCPFQLKEKALGKGDFSLIPNGCGGVELMYPYLLSQANQGYLSFNQVAALCATNVAKIFGCAEQKGSVTVGKDGDLVIYDPKAKVKIENTKLHGAGDHTIWQGLELVGYPVAVYSRGRLVYQDGQFMGAKGDGRFVKCQKFTGAKLLQSPFA